MLVLCCLSFLLVLFSECSVVYVKNYGPVLKQHARGMEFLWKKGRMESDKIQKMIYHTK